MADADSAARDLQTRPPVAACIAALVLGSLLWSCDTRTGMIIDPDEIPIYPNAQGVAREGPTHYAPDAVGLGWAEAIYVWRFTTNDPPEAVWRYYQSEMRRRWGFYAVSSPQSDHKELMLSDNCPFYDLLMTSKPTDSASYSITLTLYMQYCA